MAGITTSPQLRESPETAKDHVPSFDCCDACAGFCATCCAFVPEPVATNNATASKATRVISTGLIQSPDNSPRAHERLAMNDGHIVPRRRVRGNPGSTDFVWKNRAIRLHFFR